MNVAVGCDHAGYALKPAVVEAVRSAGHAVVDVGTFDEQPVDYPDIARQVGLKLQAGTADRGILVCGSGVGACIAANKMKGVYASICHDTYSAAQGVQHDDMNLLCLGGRVIGPELAASLVQAFLSAEYQGNEPAGERHARRVAKLRSLER